jgi:hypothetical protein
LAVQTLRMGRNRIRGMHVLTRDVDRLSQLVAIPRRLHGLFVDGAHGWFLSVVGDANFPVTLAVTSNRELLLPQGLRRAWELLAAEQPGVTAVELYLCTPPFQLVRGEQDVAIERVLQAHMKP